MSEAEYTVADLRLLWDGTARGASVDFLFAQDHDARVSAVRKAVDFVCNELEMNKHVKQGLGEDAITIEICSLLKAAGFQAAHDKDIGGHCDISIEGKNLFLWLAEAKKHSSYDWLEKGFQHLSTRYSTGVKGQDHGDVLVYCFVKDAKELLKKWKEKLTTANPEVVAKESADGNPLQFCSTHKHAASGLDFNIRHKAIALYWDPKDK